MLTVYDHFSKWAEALPLRNHTAPVVATALFTNVLVRFGMPRRILSDQGAEFESNLFQELCRMMNIDKVRTTPYKPSTNGQVERLHRTLNGMLARVVRADQRDWCTWLPSVMAAYRATPHESTGRSPNAIMFGRENCMPIDVVLGGPNGDKVTPQPADDYVYNLHERLSNSYQLVRQHLGKAASRRKAQYDVGVKESSFQRGDWVWYFCPRKKVGLSPKMQRWYDGPFLIVRVIDSHTLVIQRSKRAKPKVVHKDKVKKYNGDAPMSWLQDRATMKQGDIEGQSTQSGDTTQSPTRSVPLPSDTTPIESVPRNDSTELSPLENCINDASRQQDSRRRKPKRTSVVEPPVESSRVRRRPEYLHDYVCHASTTMRNK
jgi:hypothetical protein